VVGGRHFGGVEVFVAGDPLQGGQVLLQLLQQGNQGVDLGGGVRLVHGLMGGGQPVGVAAAVDQFDADRARVVAAGVVGDALHARVLVHAAVAIDVEMAAVAGAGGGVEHFF